MPLHYLPPVKPSAIALGTVFNHGVELAVLAPVFGQTYQRARAASTKDEFLRSREASGAAAAWGTSFVGAAVQSYAVAALLNATGTLSYKGAACLGGPELPRPGLLRKEAPRHRRRQRRRQALRDGRLVPLPHLVGDALQSVRLRPTALSLW